MILAEHARPHLITFDTIDHSDFVNAIYADVSSSFTSGFNFGHDTKTIDINKIVFLAREVSKDCVRAYKLSFLHV